MGSSEDRRERAADEEAAYNDLESSFIYQNMKPNSIGVWEWRLMFKDLPMHEQHLDAVRDAKAMASELGIVTMAEKYGLLYWALPHDYWGGRSIACPTIHSLKKLHFLKLLVVKGYYPNIAEIAHARNHRRSLFTHQLSDVEPVHQEWKKEYAQLSIVEKKQFDLGIFKNPIPIGFWDAPEFHMWIPSS